MSQAGDSYIRIFKLHFINPKRFQGVLKFVFYQQQTLIVGGNGTGKIALVNTLAALGENVETEGDRELIKKYKEVVIINGADPDFDHEGFYTDGLNQTEISKETRLNFESILQRKLWKMDVYKDMNSDEMAMGEKLCFKYAYIFAVRKLLNIELPVIINSPYGLLDNCLREGLREFLNKQMCQQILLGTEAEFKGDNVQYNLKQLR